MSGLWSKKLGCFHRLLLFGIFGLQGLMVFDESYLVIMVGDRSHL